ncbi:MAG: hypothetical protein IIX04_02735, partial [Alistipes sp.]|nr:hypothetical protein [Alistipes sp.]
IFFCENYSTRSPKPDIPIKLFDLQCIKSSTSQNNILYNMGVYQKVKTDYLGFSVFIFTFESLLLQQ